MSRLASIILGDFAIGSILDPIGNFILNSDRIDAEYRCVIEWPAPGIIDRQSVFEPLQTGILSIGQKTSSVLEVYLALVRRDAAICEFFMLVRELPAFLMLLAYREIYLFLRQVVKVIQVRFSLSTHVSFS